MIWLYYLFLTLLLFTGLFLNVLTLPGLWLMALSLATYAWITGWDVLVGWPSMITMIVLAGVAEIIEFVAAGAGAKAAGASKWGMLGALVGGLLGAIFLSFIPIPVISTIVGLCLGCFLGAGSVELMLGKNLKQSTLIGAGAAKGRFYAILIKICFGVVMLLIGMWAAFPLFR